MASPLKYAVFGWLLLAGSCLLVSAAEHYIFFDANEYELFTIASKDFAVSGEAGSLWFDAKCSLWGLGNLKVDAFSGGAWKTIANVTVTENYTTYGPFRMEKNTTQLRFYTELGATLSKFFKNIAVSEAHYIEAVGRFPEFSETEQEREQTVKIRYANIAGPISVTSCQSDFMVLQPDTLFGETDDRDSCEIRVLFFPSHKVSEGEILVTDERDTLFIPVKGVMSDSTFQFIYWNQDFSALHVGDVVPLTAAASSRLPIVYTSDNEQVAVVNNGSLIAKKEGLAVLSAEQPGNMNYRPAVGISAYVAVSVVGLPLTTFDKVSISPNPANDYFEIRSEVAISDIAVFDCRGNCLLEERGVNANQISVSIGHLQAGVYVVAVMSEKGRSWHKLLVY